MKKRYFTAILLIALFFVIGANTYEAAVPVTQEGYKNLTVLPKDISKAKLDSVMANWAISLGVSCGFCHAAHKDTTKKGLDFASDDNEHKGIARDMMEMTSYINANYFNFSHSLEPDTIHVVMCYTCHRGTKEPDSKAFLSLIDSTIQSHRKR